MAGNGTDTGDGWDLGKAILPPIGSRSSRRADIGQSPPADVDRFSKAMDKVLADRAMASKGGEGGLAGETTASHIMARGESQMASKHGIAKLGTGVADKFNAAMHNTALMSAMGHPELEKLVAREEEEKRRRRARVKELNAQRLSMNGRASIRGGGDSSRPAHGQSDDFAELNVYAALGAEAAAAGRMVPASRTHSLAMSAGFTLGDFEDALGKGNLPALHVFSGAMSRSGPAGMLATADDKHATRKPRLPYRGRRRSHTSAAEAAARARARAAPQVRATSRVGKVLTAFAGQDDWAAVVWLRHSLATILQANVRGWLVRRRWRADPHGLVAETHARIEAARAASQRRAAMKAELERRAMTRRQKEKAGAVLSKMFGGKAGHGHGGSGGATGPGGDGGGSGTKWGRLGKNVDIAKEQLAAAQEADPLDETDSDGSDLEGAADVAAVKMRARTPPWQKVEQSAWEGQWAKLQARQTRGTLDVQWDLTHSVDRMEAVRARRAEREVAGKGGGDGGLRYDPASGPLPTGVVEQLLLGRYTDKYARLGLTDRQPLRAAAEAAEAAARRQAAAALTASM